MSTRSLIARWTDRATDRWEGRYHHSDGYPSGLGATLFRLAQRRDLDTLLRVLIDDHPAGWSTINGANWDATPGFGDRCEVCGLHFVDHRRSEPFPHDFTHGPRCHCHGERHQDATNLETPDNAGDTWCEWVYVLDPSDRSMTILEHGAGRWHRHTIVNLDGPEPDWRALDELRVAESA